MSRLTETPVKIEEGREVSRKRTISTSEVCIKRTKPEMDTETSENEKKSNFSLLSPNGNGTIKLVNTMNKPGAATKKLIIKNFRSKFWLTFFW